MPIDYHEIKRQAWKQNIISVNLSDVSVRLKIGNWATLRGIDVNDLLLDIESSKYFRFAFAKDPNRQNIYEKAALDFLRCIPLIKDITKLPLSGEKALFVSNGILTLGENTSRTRREEHKSKSIDFKFTIRPYGQRTTELMCYAMHKYTEVEGGAQDNQYTDLQVFLENCPTKRHECFIVFADGDYYTSRLETMKGMFDIPTKRRIFTLNEFEICVMNGGII